MAAVTTMPVSTSDPFLSSHLVETAPSLKPKLKLRPASMVLPGLPTFTAPTTYSNAMATIPAEVSPPSPAPFIGTSNNAVQYASTGPVQPPSPMLPSLYSCGYGVPRSPLSPLRQVNEDYGFPAAPMARSMSDRLSPYSMADRKTAVQRSKLQQLFGKAPELSRQQSPAGFPFPNATPPLTPTSPASETSSARMSPLLTPLSMAPGLSSMTPPTSVSPPPPVTDGEVSSKALANHTLHPRFAREYRILGELGSGGFGFVLRAIRLSDKRIVAVKFISIAKVPSHAWVKIPNWDGGNHDGNRGGEALIPIEAFVLRRVKHEGVVSFVDLFEQGAYFYLVMEHHGSPWVAPEKEKHLTSPSTMPALAAAAKAQALEDSMQIDDAMLLSSSPTPMARTGGLSASPPAAAPPMLRRASCDLFECIEQHKRLPEATARFVFFQVCDAVRHLLRMGICHRDIKDENIVIDKQYRVKLIDFGSAVIHDPRAPPPYYNRFWGTMNFAAAEILNSQPYRAPQAEVWALGVLLCLLVLGETPFSSMDRAREGRPSVSFHGISRDCSDLIMRCLITNPDERITIDGILAHPWLCPPSPPLMAQLSPPRMTRATTHA